MPLFTAHIERLGSVIDGDRVPIENGSEARWALDGSGRQWVRKHERDTGFQPLLAEALSFLIGRCLQVRQPEGAVYEDVEGWSWMSQRITAGGEHWEPDMRDFICNPNEVAAMFVLDALTLNEDRHRRNMLVQPEGDETRLRVWAIDSGNALIGQISDYLERGLDPPSPHNHALGLPIAALHDAAIASAGRAAHLDANELSSYVAHACLLVKEPRSSELAAALIARCRSAPAIVTSYLERLGARP